MVLISAAATLVRIRPSVCGIRWIHGPPVPSHSDLYDDVAQYPDIKTFRNKDEANEFELVNKVKSMGTVEEKQVYVNLPKILGWRTFHLPTSRIPPAALESVRFMTNTTVVPELPKAYDDPVLDAEAERETEAMEASVKNFLSFHFAQERLGMDIENDKIFMRERWAVGGARLTAPRKRVSRLVCGLNRLLMGRLCQVRTHLRTACVDYGPRNEAFWFRGHLDPDWTLVRRKRGRMLIARRMNRRTKYQGEEDVEAKVDQPVQILCDDAHLQIRCSKALEPFLGFDDPLVVSGDVPQNGYLPKHNGWARKRRHGTNLLATWTGTATPFGHLAFADSSNFLNNLTTSTAWREDSEHNERQELLLEKVILNGFAVTMAQACNQGFSPFNDPTRGFASQVAITDGRRFKLGVFQLNKTAMQGVSEANHSMRRNICWHLEERQLFEGVDESSGQVVGFDRDLLKDIVKMYLVEPKTAESDIPNEGYLDPAKRHLYQVRNQYNREGLHKNHRLLCSNRKLTIRQEKYKETLAWQRLWLMRHPEVGERFSYREHPWFKMRDLCFKGREHWDPEFRWFDNQPGPIVLAKNRGPRGKGRTPRRSPFVTAPLPPDDE